LINTHAAAASGLLTWTVIDAILGNVSVSGSCIGPIIGLVAITPACGYVDPGWALVFGFFPTLIIYFLLKNKAYLRVDDTLDVALVHGFGECRRCSRLTRTSLVSVRLSSLGGIIGAFMTGLFADKGVNPSSVNGAFFGRPVQIWYQIAGILTAIGNV
jgi:ammonium transporter, Amt family